MKTPKLDTMKQVFTLLFLLASLPLLAQEYNNEWIQHNQTYYKFKVDKEGLFRISQPVLEAAGLGSTPVENFELWRNGEPVPFYSSVENGALPADGYLEFWGQLNDGKPDTDLYRDPEFQHSTKRSLISDTAFYFLSVNPNGTGFRFQNVPNNVASNTLPAEPYFMHKLGPNPNSLVGFFKRINPGFAINVGEYIYSSSYDRGEYWSTNPIAPNAPFGAATHSALFVYASGPSSTLSFGASGNAMNARSIKVRINGNEIKDTVMDYFNDLNTTIEFPTSLITTNAVNLQFVNTSAVTTDRMVISHYEISYPRLFNFGNLKNFPFELPAKNEGYYLEIANFSFGTMPPVLYDLSNGRRIVGITASGKTRFVIPASSRDMKLVLVNQEKTNTTSVTALTQKNFIQFSNGANQGNYIIISHPTLFNGTNGNNPVAEYKAYRESAAGGGYSVQIVDINELVDQFAFGIKKHPLSIKNFLRYARTKFATPPKYVFIIGRGMAYSEYNINQSKVDVESLNLVPSFGYPASDNLLASKDGASPVTETPIGRLSVISPKEVENYIEKLKEYEWAQKNLGQTVAERAWMKNVVHVTGSSDPYLGNVLCNYMGVYKNIITDTLFGAKVSTFCKTSATPMEQISNERISQLFEEGISILTYFGHSSSTTLEFNLDNPQSYNNPGKYPVFFVNGCNAGNFFTYNPQRLVVNETLSEKFVLAKQRGTIAFVASTHFGLVNYLNLYLNNLYTIMGKKDYGKSLGEINMDALSEVMKTFGPDDYYSRMHAEQITLHGDPALKLNFQPQPDYIIEEPQIKIDPAFVSIAENNFRLKVNMINVGKAINDSITVEVKRQYPDGSTGIIYRAKRQGIHYADSLELQVPIVATRDKGANKITVTIDADFNVDEMSESNNTVTKEFFIFEDEARPVYPYTFSIVNNQQQKFFASTANPFSEQKDYVFEMDTTELFNSGMKVSRTVNSTGGILEFVPGVNFKDSVVYYWRVAGVPGPGEDFRWNSASFVFLENSSFGWNQSHFFQHKKDTYKDILLVDERSFMYDTLLNHLSLKSSLYPYGQNSANLNGEIFFDGGCGFNLNSLEFMVFDLKTGRYLENADLGDKGSFGSLNSTCKDNGIKRPMLFDFYYNDPVYRRRTMDFLDSIPNNSIITMMNWGSQTFNSKPHFVDTWKKDTALYGSNQSIYHKLLGIGLTRIDSFYRNIPFLFVFKKNDDGSYSVMQQVVGSSPLDLVNEGTDFESLMYEGNMASTVIGPAKSWKSLHWNGSFVNHQANDSLELSLYGISANNNEVLLYRSNDVKKDTTLDFISAAEYPMLRLRVISKDDHDFMPYQLKYWQVKYDELPEGGVEPKTYFQGKDSLEIGEPLKFGVAFRNVSNAPFDSVAVKVTVIDRNNVPHNIVLPKQKPIIVGDSIHVNVELNTENFPERNTLFVDVNPDNDQPEQYHFNNFIYRTFFVKTDNKNPLLDVTFDGVHILNRDIVSAKPHIQIKLKDEAKFMLLNDTALSSVQVRYPDGTMRSYNFDNDTLRFTPATSGGDNTATVDFYPSFMNQIKAEGDEYELIVKGKDRSGNKAGEVEYRVAFKVISKPMISNLLNYPNPFTTSTAFVFTVTGSEVPHNLKIQILTVTGKIVREITKDELGPIHIGRNITEFKWDGTDQYGQRLANGVYLYRVVSTLNGKRMEKYKSADDNTDQFFTNGYGKMYLMK